MDNVSQTYYEKEVEDEGHKFIVFFLNDDEDQSVHVEEVKEINFFEVIQHLNFGGSVFITHKRNPKRNINSRSQVRILSPRSHVDKR